MYTNLILIKLHVYFTNLLVDITFSLSGAIKASSFEKLKSKQLGGREDESSISFGTLSPLQVA